MNNIYSQSETDAYLQCQMKHYYAFGEPCKDGSHGIAPKQHSVSLTRGTIGHDVLANYYNGIRDGLSIANATEQALAEHYAQMAEHVELMDLYNEITTIFLAYVEHYKDEFKEYEPLVAEKEFRYELPESLSVFAFKPDLIMRNKTEGKVYVIDHKFLYNFYNPVGFGIMPQLPKYIKALRLLGYPVADGMYNQLSTRKNSKEPFRRAKLKISNAKVDYFWNEQVRLMAEIHGVKHYQTNDEWRAAAHRNANYFNCKNCPFLELCTNDIERANGRELFLRLGFEPNKYGYGKTEDYDG